MFWSQKHSKPAEAFGCEGCAVKFDHRLYFEGAWLYGCVMLAVVTVAVVPASVMSSTSIRERLTPAEARKTSEVTGKMRGVKQKRVFLCADELSELSQALLDTAKSADHPCSAAPPVAPEATRGSRSLGSAD